MTEQKCLCHRIAVSIGNTLQNDQFEAHFRQAIQCIPAEEYARIPTLRHKEDALGYLIGRLLLRYATVKCAGTQWNEIKLARTPQGKPYLVNPADTTFGINVSHQGDYVGLASSCTSRIGVDIMRLDNQRNNKTADEYITEMAGSASKEELRMMRTQNTDAMKMTMFYRYWCLKEAICKATGEGILDDLTRLDFRVVMADRYKPKTSFVTSTTVLLDGHLQDQWVFEESFIEFGHSVAVCREKKLPRHCVFRQDPDKIMLFSTISLSSILENAMKVEHLPDDGVAAFAEFMAKPKRAF